MKKSLLIIGMFSLMMVLTSFNTPNETGGRKDLDTGNYDTGGRKDLDTGNYDTGGRKDLDTGN